MPRPVDTREVPEGYELAAVPESTLSSGLPWRISAGEQCSQVWREHGEQKRCQEPGAADLKRGRSWYHYCPRHMYGRWIEDGQVMVRILREKGKGDA